MQSPDHRAFSVRAIRTPVVLLTLSLLGVAQTLDAQSIHTFGRRCAAGPSACISRNTSTPANVYTPPRGRWLYIRVKASSLCRIVMGTQLRMRSLTNTPTAPLQLRFVREATATPTPRPDPSAVIRIGERVVVRAGKHRWTSLFGEIWAHCNTPSFWLAIESPSTNGFSLIQDPSPGTLKIPVWDTPLQGGPLRYLGAIPLAQTVLCDGNVPTLGASTPPRIGRTFRLDASNLNARPSQIILGPSKTSWSGLNLPIQLFPYGAPGCDLSVAWDAALPVPGSGSRRSLAFTVPNLPGLVGKSAFFQVVQQSPGTNSLGLTTSNGVGIQIGP